MKYNVIPKLSLLLAAMMMFSLNIFAGDPGKDLDKKLKELMSEGDIPGLSLVMVKGNQTIIRSLGYADVEAKRKVTPQTLFEIGSCTKAFTALAALKLEAEGKIDLNAPVKTYLPWLNVTYKGKNVDITPNQLLHHTSGVPFKTISSIPEDNSTQALENTVRTLAGIKLANMPGTVYEYATINYDVIGLIIEKVSGMPYETYMRQNIFLPLGLKNTFFANNNNGLASATGYKIGFFQPKKYDAPVFRGNYPAGYISSTAEDMGRWLSIQMGLIKTPFDDLLKKSHVPDLSVAPQGVTSYAYGWMVNPYGNQKISHAGNNPNFTAEVAFYKANGIGVAVLTNSNSAYTPVIAEYALNALTGSPQKDATASSDNIDRVCSLLCLLLGAYALLMLVLSALKVKKLVKGETALVKMTGKKLRKAGLVLLLALPYLAGVYLIPEALVGFTWTSIFVWTPLSFKFLVALSVAAMAASYLFYFTSLFTASKNKHKDVVPVILLLSIISGLANTIVLFIITTAFYTTIPYYYLLYYFALAYGLYVICTRVAQAKLIHLTNEVTFDIRAYLINKIVRTPYQKFEKIKDGRVVNILNSDTSVIANSANVYINFISNLVTIFSAFAYMMTISVVATLIVFGLILLLAWYYYFISNKARFFLEDARNTMNVYTGLINGLTKGFKQLSIHFSKKHEYKDEMIDVSDKYKNTTILASFKFLNATIIGNSFIMVVLGLLSILVPQISSGINTFIVISFVMVLLYIIGPINLVLGSVQQVTAVNVAWGRIAEFIREINASASKKISFWGMMDSIAAAKHENAGGIRPTAIRKIENIEISGLGFKYKTEDASAPEPDHQFALGPIDLDIEAGETVFIIGGNGSGKTTFMNLLTGLYKPDEGAIKINGKAIAPDDLGEYFSAVFSGNHLFQKIYGNDLGGREEDIKELLRKVKLSHKVDISNNAFSTIDLSGGQRKRLALLECYLDNRPVFLFDEFAADQDPEFRKYFYRELLPDLKARGKTVIAVTHDDHYFDVADKVIKLDYGKVDAGIYGKVLA
jgi:putative pyoverdin transport system ATP-binding/permease protein